MLDLNTTLTSAKSVFAAEDITDRLRQRYPRYLKADIVSVKIVQPGDRVWLEITQEKQVAGYLVDQVITRTDLGFIRNGVGSYDLYFSPTESVSTNAGKFVDDFGADAICMTTDLFHEDACREEQERRDFEVSERAKANTKNLGS